MRRGGRPPGRAAGGRQTVAQVTSSRGEPRPRGLGGRGPAQVQSVFPEGRARGGAAGEGEDRGPAGAHHLHGHSRPGHLGQDEQGAHSAGSPAATTPTVTHSGAGTGVALAGGRHGRAGASRAGEREEGAVQRDVIRGNSGTGVSSRDFGSKEAAGPRRGRRFHVALRPGGGTGRPRRICDTVHLRAAPGTA